MRAENVSHNPRIESLTKMTKLLEGSGSPFETLQILRRGMWEMYGPAASVMISTVGLAKGEYRVVMVQLPNGAPPTYFDLWAYEQVPIRRGGILAEMIREAKPQLFQDVNWSGDPELAERLGSYSSVMAMPIGSKRLPVTWVLLLRPRPSVFGPDDLVEAMLRTALIGTLMESQRIAGDLEVANARIDGEIRQLAQLQRELLPDPLPNISGLEIAVSYEPSGRAGGDLYDFFPLKAASETTGRWCVFIGDASGHGAAAAVVMAIVQAILRAHPKDVHLPSELLVHANRHLCSKKLGGYVTAFLGIYAPSTKQLVYACSGHPAPMVKTASDGELIMLNEVGSYPLGIDKGNRFKDATFQFRAGDTTLLYTDGITEARNRAGDMFELDRLQWALKSAGDGPEQLIRQIREAVSAFEGGRDQVDDQTMVALRATAP